MAQKKRKTRVMVFGTFDGLHPGHLNFFRQARKLAGNSFLIVSVARDRNVAAIKGELPILSERQRVLLVKKAKLVDKVILSGLGNHLPHIMKEKPDIIALGYDQRFYVKNLKRDLRNEGILVRIARLKPYKEEIYKSHLLHKKKKR